MKSNASIIANQEALRAKNLPTESAICPTCGNAFFRRTHSCRGEKMYLLKHDLRARYCSSGCRPKRKEAAAMTEKGLYPSMRMLEPDEYADLWRGRRNTDQPCGIPMQARKGGQ